MRIAFAVIGLFLSAFQSAVAHDEGGTGDPRAELKIGQSSNFPVRGAPGGEMIVCGTNRDIMKLVCSYPAQVGPPAVPAHTETYKVALRCTLCPGTDPY